jgi:hypothetical protein
MSTAIDIFLELMKVCPVGVEGNDTLVKGPGTC